MSFIKNNHKEKIDLPIAIFKTNMGTFEAELYSTKCPETVWNFINLAEGVQETPRGEKYYNGLTFHRIISGFVIQGGCPFGNGTGGPGYQFKDEFDSSLRHDTAGILSMANSGADTNGSQFFITLAPTPHLDNKHSIFGKVIEGIDIVNKIGSCDVGYMDKPNNPVIIGEILIKR